MNFLFWNIKNNKIGNHIKHLCDLYKIDILILAESPYPPAQLLTQLNEGKTEFYPQNPLSQCDKIQIFTKFHHDFIRPISENSRLTIRELALPLTEKILITAIHYVDKRNNSDESQSEEAGNLIRGIEEAENSMKNHKNIIIGDFNMNPFEKPLIKANGFNATMSARIALEETKVVQGKKYKYFYNPMWGLFGDIFSIPVGTYYYKRAEHINYQWNIFDQVLIRPSLIQNFDKKSLKIIHKIGRNTSLITSNETPNKKISDHLPITFALNLCNIKN